MPKTDSKNRRDGCFTCRDVHAVEGHRPSNIIQFEEPYVPSEKSKSEPELELSHHSVQPSAPMATEKDAFMMTGEVKRAAACSNKIVQYILLSLQVIAVIVFVCCDVDYAENETGKDAQSPTLWAYGHFQDVHVMIYIGFGFLMTFLQDYNWSSVGFNFLLGAVSIEWSFIVSYVLEGKLRVDYTTMFNAEFAAGAVLISYGALLGKVNHLQLLVMALLEIVFYKCNEHAALHWATGLTGGFKDVGGSMIIHAFGAYFGLSAAKMLHHKKHVDHEKEASNYHNDLFAMIGTVFLWMYWPSFNGIPENDPYVRQIIATNTYVALAAACITTFALSGFGDEDGHGRLDMVHIQNATLAGGVAMGSSADIHVGIWGAVIIGSLAGAFSTVGYIWLQEQVLKKLNIHDTCGVHNLHGIPGIMGCLFSMIFGGALGVVNPVAQICTLLMTLTVAILGGLFTGWILDTVCLSKFEKEQRDHFEDAEHWKKSH